MEGEAEPIWESRVGHGFQRGARHFGISVGGGPGLQAFGTDEQHDFVLANVNAGWIVTEVYAPGTLLRGNLEFRGEIFGGQQLEPARYVVGLTPTLRYHFVTGTRVIPFLQGGAGVSATDIKRPDLSTLFQFNLNAGAGLHVFVSENVSLSAEYRFFHLSNAGIREPNGGVNAHIFLAGVSHWF